MTLDAKQHAKDDEVLGESGDAHVNDIHRAHCATGIVEHPFEAVCVEQHAHIGIDGSEIGKDVQDHARCVVGQCGERGECGELQLIEMDWVENIPSSQSLE